MSRLVITSSASLTIVSRGGAGLELRNGRPRFLAPPPPGQCDSPPLEGPATDLEPIPADVPAAQDQAVRDDDLAVTQSRRAASSRFGPRGERVVRSQTAAAGRRRTTHGQAASAAGPVGFRLLGLGPRLGPSFSGWADSGRCRHRTRSGSPAGGPVIRTDGIGRPGSGAVAAAK